MSNLKSKFIGIQRGLWNTTLYGQTCDGHDEIMPGIPFPEVDVGELIKFRELGAYSDSIASNFNGYNLPYHIYYVSQAAKTEMMKLSRWPRIEKFLKHQPFVYWED